jgi:DNA-binding beta-propeller fold protein YncE
MRKVLVMLVALALLIGTQIVVANAAVVTFRQSFGGPFDDVARGIFVDSNYIYIVGRTRSTGTGAWDLFLAIFNRADNSFRCIRAVDIGGVDDFGQAVVAYTSMGVTYVYVIGYTYYGANPSNVLLVKFDTTNCIVLGAAVYDVDGADQPFGLTISPDGLYLYIAGFSSSAAHLLKVQTSDLSIVWARKVTITGAGDSANSVTISGNKLYVTGRTSANDLFVARFDANTGGFDGPDAYKIFRTLQFEEGRDIVVAGGKVYVAGIHQLPTGNQEFLFMMLDPNTLNLELARTFGTPGVEDIFSLSMVGDLAYAVGYSNHFGSFDVVLFAVNRLTGVLSHAFVLGDGATDQGAYDSASTGTCLIYTGATKGWDLSYRVLDLDDVNDATISFSTPSGSPSSYLIYIEYTILHARHTNTEL